MKNIKDFLVEALGENLSPKDFMDIWKGKNPKIDSTSINAAYFASGVMNVHRDKLPTEDEFTNLCEWLIENTSWTREDYNSILIRMMETYLKAFSIKDDDILGIPVHVNNFKGQLGVGAGEILASILFFNMKKIIDTAKFDDYKKANAKLFEPIFSKYKVTWETWPDYSKGWQMLVDHAK